MIYSYAHRAAGHHTSAYDYWSSRSDSVIGFIFALTILVPLILFAVLASHPNNSIQLDRHLIKIRMLV